MSALREILAHFSIAVDDAQLKKGEAGVEGFIGTLKNFAGALGTGLALGAISHFVLGLSEEADALAKQSATLGLSIGALQEWQFAAKMSGIEAETLNAAIARLSGGKFDPKAMAELGVKTSTAAGEIRPTADLLEDVADKLKGIENPAKRNQLAMGVLGKSYAKLMPLLLEGKDGIQKLRTEFQELGGGFTEEFAGHADELGDNVDRVKTVWKNLTIFALASFMPMLVTLSKRIVAGARALVPLIKNSKALHAAASIAALKGVLVLSRSLGGLGGVMRVLLTRMLPIVAAFLVLEDLFVFFQGGDSLFGRFLESTFGPGTSQKVRDWTSGVRKEVMGFFKDLTDSSRDQKLKDDWAVFWAQLAKDTDGFSEIAIRTGKVFSDSFISALSGIKTAFGLAWQQGEMLGKGIILVGGWISSAFTAGAQTVELFAASAIKALGWIGKLVEKVIELTSIDVGSVRGGKAPGSEQTELDRMVRGVAKLPAAREPVVVATTGRALEGGNVPANMNVEQKTNINVTVPPGTDADMARRVGNAAADGQAKSNRATYAALVPGRG